MLQYVRFKKEDGDHPSLTVIAGIGQERFAGTMQHIAQMCADHAEEALAEQVKIFQERINALEARFKEVSKVNARMRDAIATIANSMEDALWRPPKRKWRQLGQTKKKILGKAVMRAADELRATIAHAYAALF